MKLWEFVMLCDDLAADHSVGEAAEGIRGPTII